MHCARFQRPACTQSLSDAPVGCRMGNGINWSGQVFPGMRNYTASHKVLINICKLGRQAAKSWLCKEQQGWLAAGSSC